MKIRTAPARYSPFIEPSTPLALNTTTIITTTPHRHPWRFIRSVTGFPDSATKNKNYLNSAQYIKTT